LPFSVTDQRLRAKFSVCGVVGAVKVPMDRATGKSRGFGYVQFLEHKAATKAVDSWNGCDFDGRNITVEFEPQLIQEEKVAPKKDKSKYNKATRKKPSDKLCFKCKTYGHTIKKCPLTKRLPNK